MPSLPGSGREFPLALRLERGEPLAVAGTAQAREGGHQRKGDTEVEQHPVRVGKLSLRRCKPQRGLLPASSVPRTREARSSFSPLVTAASLLSPCCCSSSGYFAGALPWSSPHPGSWCCWLRCCGSHSISHTGVGGCTPGTGAPCCCGSLPQLQPAFPCSRRRRGGARDGKLAASSEGSGKNELKPRKMRPRRRVGGEAKGGHGEALGNEGRKEGGGAGGGPGAACGPQLGPQLGQVVRGLGGPSSKCSRGYPSAIRPITIHPWLSTGPSATSTGPTCSRCYLPPRCSCQCHQHQCYRSRCAPLSSPPPWDKGPRWLLAGTWLCWDASPAGCPGPPRAWAPLEWAAETRLFFARFPQSVAQGHPSCRRQNPLPPGRQRCTEPVRVGHRQDEPSVPAGS